MSNSNNSKIKSTTKNSQQHSSYIQLQETSRVWRTELPNIVAELLSSGEISASDLALYIVYRKIAGEHGACWIGTRGLEKQTGLSHTTITKCKKNLAKSFSLLNGKSLIEITRGDPKKEEADTITIIDIWTENFQLFKKRLTCAKNLHTPVQEICTPPCKKLAHKKEPLKKEPLNNNPASPEQAPSAVVVPSLNKINISEDEKKKISYMFTPQDIDIATARYFSWDTKKSPLKAIWYILRNPDKWSDNDEPFAIEENKKYLKELEKIDGQIYSHVRIDVCWNRVEFVRGSNVDICKVDEPDFISNVKSFLEKIKK